MTVAEFLECKDEMVCRECHAVGFILSERNPNNGGVRGICAKCGSPGTQWLAQQMVRTPKRGLRDTMAVWLANGDHCSFCGKTRQLCSRLGIGLTAQHVVPFAEAGDEWPLIPFCARCQQASLAALEETKRVTRTINDLDSIIRRIEEKNPELR